MTRIFTPPAHARRPAAYRVLNAGLVCFLFCYGYLLGFVHPHLPFFAHGLYIDFPVFLEREALVEAVWHEPGAGLRFLSEETVRYLGVPMQAALVYATLVSALLLGLRALLARLRLDGVAPFCWLAVALVLLQLGRYVDVLSPLLAATFIVLCLVVLEVPPWRPVARAFAALATATFAVLFMGRTAALLPVFLLGCEIRRVHVTHCSRPPTPARITTTGWLARALPALLLLLPLSRDHAFRGRLLLNYYARMEDWPNVLAVADTLDLEQAGPSPAAHSLMLRYDVTRALHETGRLQNELFRYPQPFLPAGHPYSQFLMAETLFALGEQAGAEHRAQEAQTIVMGRHPLILRLLSRIYASRGHADSARTYARALAHDPSCRAWATPLFQGISTVSPAATALLHASGPRALDYGYTAYLRRALDRCPTNRRAIELLAAEYMVRLDGPALLPLLPGLLQSGHLGRAVQESLALASVRGEPIPAAVIDHHVAPEVLRHAAAFVHTAPDTNGGVPATPALDGYFRHAATRQGRRSLWAEESRF